MGRNKRDPKEPQSKTPKPKKARRGFAIGTPDAGIEVGIDARLDLNISGNYEPALVGLDGPADLRGKAVHRPEPGGRMIKVHHLVYNPKDVKPAAALKPALAPAASVVAGFMAAGPERRCTCGFVAFAWQRACPKCDRSLGQPQGR